MLLEGLASMVERYPDPDYANALEIPKSELIHCSCLMTCAPLFPLMQAAPIWHMPNPNHLLPTSVIHMGFRADQIDRDMAMDIRVNWVQRTRAWRSAQPIGGTLA